MIRALLIALIAVVATVARAEDAKLADAQYPECALWHDGKLYYEEMAKNVVRVSDLKTRRTFWEKEGCGPVNIAPYRDDEFLVLCHLAHVVVRVSRVGKTVAVIDRDANGRPFVYPNGAGADGGGGEGLNAARPLRLASSARSAPCIATRSRSQP